MSTPLPPPIALPKGFDIPAPTLNQPVFLRPRWQPVPIYREDVPALKSKDQTKSAPADTSGNEPKQKTPAPSVPPSFAEVRKITIPLIDKDIPVPATEILVTAVSTAGVSSVTAVAGTLVATSMFGRIVKLAKPLTKAMAKKLAKLRKKQAPLTWARARRLERCRRR